MYQTGVIDRYTKCGKCSGEVATLLIPQGPVSCVSLYSPSIADQRDIACHGASRWALAVVQAAYPAVNSRIGLKSGPPLAVFPWVAERDHGPRSEPNPVYSHSDDFRLSIRSIASDARIERLVPSHGRILYSTSKTSFRRHTSQTYWSWRDSLLKSRS